MSYVNIYIYFCYLFVLIVCQFLSSDDANIPAFVMVVVSYVQHIVL